MPHPAARLLSWLLIVLALQFFAWPALLVAALGFAVLGGEVRRRWWVLVRRARWLLLSLGLILAYGTPGDAWLDLAWAPTAAGLREAGLHAARLVVMLGALAWLFSSLPRERLMAGLWALLRPLGRLQLAADRLVVRLALVFTYLENSPPRASWQHLLAERGHDTAGMDVVRIELPRWQEADSAWVLGTALLMGAALWLS